MVRKQSFSRPFRTEKPVGHIAQQAYRVLTVCPVGDCASCFSPWLSINADVATSYTCCFAGLASPSCFRGVLWVMLCTLSFPLAAIAELIKTLPPMDAQIRTSDNNRWNS